MDEDEFAEMQSRLKGTHEPPIDPNTLRISREQFEREEQERIRQSNLQRMKEQHKKFEQATGGDVAAASSLKPGGDKVEEPSPTSSNVFSAIATSIVNSTSTLATTPAPAAASVLTTQTQQSTWRNLMGSGNAPKLSAEAEFPSLGGDSKKPAFSSFSSIGASISSKQTGNPWKAPTKVVDEQSRLG